MDISVSDVSHVGQVAYLDQEILHSRSSSSICFARLDGINMGGECLDGLVVMVPSRDTTLYVLNITLH